MRLRRLDLTRYGKFTDHVIDFGDRVEGAFDLHIVYGLNEAGKSTALSGYLDLLFGIEERSRYGFLHQYGAMEVGAVLEFGGAQHALRRLKQRGGSLRDASGQPVSEAVLGGALTGLTRDAYRMMFSLDDHSLEEGGNAILDSKGDLGELLFSASAGLAGLSKALTTVAGEADGIFRKRASTTEIAGLKRRLADLKASRDSIDTQASAHATLVTEMKRAEQAYQAAVQERAGLKVQQDELGCLIRAAPLAAEHGRLSDELASLADLPRPPSHWTTALPALMVDAATLQTKLQGLDGRLERLRIEIDGIVIDPGLLRLADRIEALASASARFQTADADLPKRRSALADSQARLAALVRSVTRRDEAIEPATLVIDASRIAALRDLIAAWSGIETQLAATMKEQEAASLALDGARDDRAALDEGRHALDPSRKATLQAGLKRLRDGDLLARQRVASRTVAAEMAAVEEALRRLAPWSGDPDALDDLAMPSSRQIQAWRDRLTDQDQRRTRHEEQHRDGVTDAVELEAKISAATAAMGLIDDAEAVRRRDAREQAWTAHRQTLDHESASTFEQLMRAVDTLAEARLAAADRLAELRGLRRDLAVAQTRTQRESELLAAVAQETLDLSADIEQACPVAFGDVRSMPVSERLAAIEAWITHRDGAITAMQALRTARTELASVEAEITREAETLGRIITAAGIEASGLTVVALVEAADTLLTTDATEAQARATADKLVRDTARSLETRRKAVAVAVAAREAWEERWTRALSGTWLSDPAMDQGAVRVVLDELAGLPALISERDGIQHRITAMEADQEHFLTELAALHHDLGEALDPQKGAEAATALLDRHKIASQAAELRRGKDEERAGLVGERVALLDDIALHEARRSEILTFFGLDTLAEVGACLDRCAHRDRVEEERKKLTTRILHETRSTSLDASLARLAGTDDAERTRADAECSQRIEDLDGRVQSLYAAKSAAADRLSAIGGDDAVLRLEADRRTVMLQIEDKALHFLHLRTGGLLAERALQVYRETHRGAMMRRASEAFRTMTRGAYSGLATRPDKDREILIGLSRVGGSKLATEMSKGTRFQLYLALRLAGYEEFASNRPAVPFLADDIMETFDEPRSEEVLSLFGGMSKMGQVIYLTHHRHLCHLARKIVPGVTVHELPS